MNILILTPDRVGSTLLQRLVTVYANINQPEKLTVNLHELTNGLAIYHNDFYGIEMLGKKENTWGYHQTLSEIVNLLENSKTDITSRLAYYHLKNRQDSIQDRLSFYEYLNNSRKSKKSNPKSTSKHPFFSAFFLFFHFFTCDPCSLFLPSFLTSPLYL